jgi:indolepyruvate ferredoxin oxidoreductase
LGVRIVTAVADGIAAVDTSIDRFPSFDPEVVVAGARWRHEPSAKLVRPDLEELWLDRRLQAARGWVAARGLDRFLGAGAGARLGIVCAGRTRRDVLGALEACGVAPTALAGAGIRILEVALTNPIVPERVLDLAGACDEILVVEEKRPFLEQQVRTILHEAGHPTPVRGKRDAAGQPLVPVAGELTAERLVDVLVRVLPDLAPPATPTIGRAALPMLEVPARTPAFCSGCPHNRSTQVPDDAVVGAGVGCHAMVLWMDRGAVGISHMGGEGSQWIGRAPFTDRAHMFQNIGDGTFFHSGSLSIRAAVAAGVNITYKLLYNRAVAMTGGQDVAGVMEVPELTRGLAAEGVRRVIVCSDEPDKFGSAADWAPNVDVWERDRLDEAQRVLRETPGVTVIVYDQQCAAEKRRDRKRGKLATPSLRVLINERAAATAASRAIASPSIRCRPSSGRRRRSTSRRATSTTRASRATARPS